MSYRIAVYEPRVRGHHLAYLRTLVPTLSKIADELVLVLSEGIEDTPEYHVNIEPLSHCFELDASLPDLLAYRPDAGRDLDARERANLELRSLRQLFDRHDPDHTYVMSADSLANPPGSTVSTKPSMECRDRIVEALVLSHRAGDPVRSLRSVVRRERSLLALRRVPWTRTFTLNPLVADLARRRGFGDRVRLLPDPALAGNSIPKTTARRRLGIPEDGRYLVLPGIVSVRKGCDRLLSAFVQAELRRNDRLLLIGTIDPPISQLLFGEFARHVAFGRVIPVDTYLECERFRDALSAADVVCAVHPHGAQSSGIVVEAAAAGRPVLGSSEGTMGRRISAFKLGWTCDITNPASFSDWIERSLELAPAFGDSRQRDAFVIYNSADNFIAHWTEYLRQRRVFPGAIKAISWNETLAVTEST